MSLTSSAEAQPNSNYRRDVYNPQLEEAFDYQDFLALELSRRGIVLNNIQGKRAQLRRENLLGMEIKLDKKFETTGNVFIETAEKSHPDRPFFVPSGIYRQDENWLYAVGNYKRLFIFLKKYLQFFERTIVQDDTRRSGPTFKGFVLSEVSARTLGHVVEF